MSEPWGVHRIGSIYSAGGPQTQTQMPRIHPQQEQGRWVRCPAEPYPGNRLIAAWWVLTGRAFALRWPNPGELESALETRIIGDD